jgi:hypothetical protein
MTSESQNEAKFWFNLKTGKVEFGLLSPAPNRVGPFKTEAEALQALELISKRNRDWQLEEERER